MQVPGLPQQGENAMGHDLKKFAVPAESLRWICPENLLDFECTTDIEPLRDFIGQERAVDSIAFGLAVERAGYNLFLTGLSGTGKATTITARLKKFVEDRTAKGAVYDIYDWCYVYNFSEPDQPKALRLPEGKAKSFSGDIQALLNSLKEEIPKTFGSEEYTKRKQDVMEEHQRKYQEYMDTMETEAKEKNLMVQVSQMGAAVVPLVDGNAMSREDFLALPEDERKEIEDKRLEMMRRVDEIYSSIRALEKEIGERMRENEKKAGEFAISGPFEDLFRAYDGQPEVIAFLNELREYTLGKLELFMQPPAQGKSPSGTAAQDEQFGSIVT